MVGSIERACQIGSSDDFSGARWRRGLPTAFVESTANNVISKRFVKKQQMRWTHREDLGVHSDC